MSSVTSLVLRGLTRSALAAGVLVLPLSVPGTASAVDDAVQGYVYRDLDNDGVRDVDEPGLRGIVLRSGKRSAITDADGHYAFTGVTQSINIRADAGWFRTQCASAFSGPSAGDANTATCPDPGAGAGADQDFRVDNQLLTATAAPGDDISLGLTPDWVGTGYADYTTDPSASMPLDPALRLSPGYRMPGATIDCQSFICRPGETQWDLTQWLNQGTKPLRGLRAVIVAPAGSAITQVTPYVGHGVGSGHTVTGYVVKDATSGTILDVGTDGWLSAPSAKIKVSLKGRLLPGSEYLTAVAYRMDDDAPFSDGNGDGLPDCSADTGEAYPGQTCTLATDFSAGSYVTWGAVIRIRRGVDADAAFCPNVPDDCPVLGVHNKTQPGDSNDAGAWKVDSAFPPG